MVDKYLDGGYGLIGNIIKHIILNEIMDDKSSEKYREKLLKQDKIRYEQYLIYEKKAEKW